MVLPHQVVYNVCEGPGHGGAEQGYAHEHQVQNDHRGEVAEPHAAAVQPGGVRVGVRRSRQDLHPATVASELPRP